MKKRWLFVLSAILAASILAGAENAGISRSPEGLFQVEQLAFGIVYWGKEWKTIILQRKTPGAFTFPGEGGTETPNGLRRDGTFQVSDTERFNFSETVRQPSANEAEFQFSLKADPGIPTEYITWQTLFTQAEYARNPAVFNGETLPAVKNKDTYRPAKKNSELVLPLKQGVLKIRGNFAVIVRELDWGVDVRLLFAGSHGAVRNATLSGVMTYQPYSARTLDLRPVLNMGFTDEAANDRRGGWTDQGPDNDLRAMTPGTREFAGIPFDVVDPAKNSEKSCLALAGAARPWFAKEAAAAVAPGVSGEALYLLNALAWAPAPNTVSGTVRVAYADGSSQTFELKCGVDTGNFWSPMPLRNAAVGWRAQNGEAGIGLYVTRLPLDASKQVSQVEFRSAGQVWMLLGATVSNRTPDNQSQLEKLVMKPNNAWTEFAFDLPTQPGSAADLSFLADAPAGKYGFLKVRGDEFEFEKRPGIPVRFWGTNLCIDALFQPETETAGMLDELKSMGYNSIRLHHFDQMLAREPERMRNLDFLFAEAKKRGIYLTLDLFTTRYPNRLAGFDKLTPNEYKLLCYFNEEAYRDLLAFAKQLLGHVNPYTGTAWKDDPALVTVNLINEGTLSNRVTGMSERLKPMVEAAFIDYAKKRGLDPAGPGHAALYEQFLADTGKGFFHRMKADLAALGVRIPLCDQNYANTALDTRNSFDYVDTHFYWGHPTYIGKQLWRLPTHTRSDSAVSGRAGGIRDVLATRIAGKPMTITEWNYCYPNPHNFEGPFLAAAYSALQNYNGLWQFTFSHAAKTEEPKTLGAFDYHSNPVMKLAARAGALFFLRGDVKPSGISVAVTEKGRQLFRARLPLAVRTGQFNPEAAAAANTLAATEEEPPPANAPAILRAKNEQQLVESLEKAGIMPKGCINFESGAVASSTGELFLNPKEQLFRVRTPRSEALILKGKASGKSDVLAVANGNADAAFFAGSLDGKPLKQSGRLQILHLTDLKSEGAVFRDPSMSVQEEAGTNRFLLRRNTATVELNHPGTCTIYACAPNGKRLFEVPFERNGDILKFTADNGSTQGCVILYELVNQQTENKK